MVNGLMFAMTVALVAAKGKAQNVTELAEQLFGHTGIETRSLFDAYDLLNVTIGGRLRSSLPISAPCFSEVNGVKVTPDAAACAVIQSNYTNATYRSAQPNGFMGPQWEECTALSEQCLLDNTNPTNPLAYSGSLANCQQGSISPYYIPVKTAREVQVAFAFALFFQVPLSIHNSGHDFKGRSSAPGSLSLWVRGLDTISRNKQFKPEGCRTTYDAMTVGAGVPWSQVYRHAEANEYTAIGGYHESVGASGGWLMGGGHSILSPVFGLGVDRVVQFKVVTPDGISRVANECTNTDLFWALRGGGGSTFGVVLESTQRVEPAMKLQVASIRFPQTATNPRRWFELIAEKTITWAEHGWGGHIGANILINVTPNLSLEQAKADVADVSAYALSQGGTVVVEEVATWNQFFTKYVPSAQVGVGAVNILGTSFVKSSVFHTPEGRAAVVQVNMDVIAAGVAPYHVLGNPYLYKHDPKATSVTPGWRDTVWHMGFKNVYGFNATLPEKVTKFKASHDVAALMRTVSPNSGSYSSESDQYEPNHEFMFWGDNYPRLAQLKKQFDPLSLLDCWQCVGWKGPQHPKFKCYVSL